MSETKYEPGTLAVATVRGVAGVRVFRTESADNSDNLSVWRHPVVNGFYYSHPKDVTDIRPLVVLDLDDPAEFVRILRGVGIKGRPDERSERGGFEHIINGSISARRLGVIADQIEAQVKPPRIPEPGKYGVVEASAKVTNAARGEWVNEGKFWRSLDFGDFVEWSELVEPTLIREGISA